MVAWFTPEGHPALLDFWHVYDECFEEFQRTSLAGLADHPTFGPLMAAMPPAAREAQRVQSRERLRQAVEGAWAPYEDHLRRQGVTFGALGIPFRDWHDVLRMVVQLVVPRLVTAYVATPARLTAALIAMQAFFDRSVAIIGEAYLDAKARALREAEHRLAITLDSIGDAVIATDLAGVVTLMNPVAERLTGWSDVDATGRPLDEVFCIEHETSREPVENPVRRVLREGVVVGLANHTALVARGGARVPIADSAAPIRTESGELRGVVLVFRDVSEERAVARADARQAAVVEASLDAIVGIDHEGQIAEFNPAAERIFGHHKADVLGRPLVDMLFPARDRELRRAGVASLLTGDPAGRLGRHHEVIALRADGREIPIEMAVVQVAGEQPRYFKAFIRDLSERALAASALQAQRDRADLSEQRSQQIVQANRLKSEFLANMSHELRTPLNAIIGFAELIADGVTGPVSEQQREFVGHILGSGRHLVQLINDVLDLAKVEAGRMDFFPEPVEVGSLVRDLVAILRTTSARKRIRVVTEIGDDLGDVVVDPARLKQVLYNYLSNALKFTPEGGVVTVRVRAEPGHQLRLEVEDNGPGITIADQARLFTEFQQLDGSVGKRHEGTGLGLALTRRLIEAQGGSVGVTSVRGEGSCFHAVLPRHRSGGLRPADAGLPAPGGATVLVVEDDPADQATTAAVLEAAGYRVSVATTGAQAIALARAHAFDAVTLDLLLPDMSGLDVLRAIRADAKQPDVPVVVITIVTEHVSSGFVVTDVLAKPIDGGALIAALQRVGVAPEVGETVVVVDDDLAALELMAATLERLRCRALCFDDGERALAALATERPAAIILDLVMPRMDGFEFLSRLRASPAHRQVPVLIWTMKDLSTDELRRIYSGAQGVVQKGHGASALITALGAYLGHIKPEVRP